jgi:hypothetical protein
VVPDRMMARPAHREFVRLGCGPLPLAASGEHDRTKRAVEARAADRSPFWKQRQGGFARDMLAHLIAPTSMLGIARVPVDEGVKGKSGARWRASTVQNVNSVHATG